MEIIKKLSNTDVKSLGFFDNFSSSATSAVFLAELRQINLALVLRKVQCFELPPTGATTRFKLFFSAFISFVTIFLSCPPGLCLLVFIEPPSLFAAFHCVPTAWPCPGQSCSARTRQSVPQTYCLLFEILVGVVRVLRLSGGIRQEQDSLWWKLAGCCCSAVSSVPA